MQKQRVSRACDNCKRRKIRCTGRQPCAHCIKNNKTCEFKASYTRGAVPEVQSAPLEEQEKFLEEVGYKRRQVWRASPKRRSPSHLENDSGLEEEGNGAESDLFVDAIRKVYDSATTRSLPTRQHGGTVSTRSYSDPEPSNNLYREPNTGTSENTSLYERTQHHINRQEYHHKNLVSAYGDPPLPEIDTPFLIFPSELTAKALVTKYFEFVSATNRLLHRPTVDRWTSELLSSVRGMRSGVGENSQRAVVLMIFASTLDYMDEECGEWDVNNSFHYFQAAEKELSKETGEIRLSTLQARLLQCLYLLSRSRINQCYSIFGTVVNLIYVLGIQRERRPSNTDDLLEIEMQKRVFWAAYVMDKYLTACLGRPQLFHDEDIDQQLPLFVEDENISPKIVQIASKDAQTPIKGAIFQITLSKILSKVLSELYGIRKSSLESRFVSAEKMNVLLRNWRSEIAHFLDLDPSLLSPLYMRQNMALRLSYSHILIILHRPFLLDTFDKQIDTSVPLLQTKLDYHVSACMDAALELVKTIDTMYKVASSFSASWFAHYCAYTAIIALYLHVIKVCSDSPYLDVSTSPSSSSSDTSPWMVHFEAASKCQDQIKSSSMAKESFAQKCCVVLEEARSEAVVKIRQAQTRQNNTWTPTGEDENDREDRNDGDRQEGIENERPQVRMEETSYFSGEWNDMNFDQSAPGGGVLYSIFNGVGGINVRHANGNLVDRIDRWGFSSLTGY